MQRNVIYPDEVGSLRNDSLTADQPLRLHSATPLEIQQQQQ